MGVWSERGDDVGGEVEVVDTMGCLVFESSVDILIAPGQRLELLAGGKVGEGGNAVVVDAESIEMGKWSEI